MNQELKDALRKLLGESALALHDADDEQALGARISALADELPALRAKAAKCGELEAAETERRKLELFDRGLKRKAFCNAQKEALMKLPLEDLENLEKNSPDHAVLPPPLPRPAGDGRKPQAVLSPEEKKIAEKMGLSDEQFAEIRKYCENKEIE